MQVCLFMKLFSFLKRIAPVFLPRPLPEQIQITVNSYFCENTVISNGHTHSILKCLLLEKMLDNEQMYHIIENRA